VTRFLLDTNIVSDAVKPSPSVALARWFADHPPASLFISAMTLAELEFGIERLVPGGRRSALERWFSGPDGPPAAFAGRILHVDERVASAWATLMAAGELRGQPRSPIDTIIAATAVVADCIVVTDNTRDFPDVETINPLRDG
jgi:hypothetical protein